ncbi:MAG: choloylglycine hydrolase, partial [Chloroflexi bacterium]|nr:choloylglycine hydrolase [Chloroflexota bacterium]
MHQEQFKQVTFNHVILQGSAYEVGRAQAEIVKKSPGFAEFLGSGKGTFSPQAFETIIEYFSKYCPGINQEVQGLADGLEIPAAHVIYYAHTYLRAGHCSHMAVLPAITENQHVLVGRSYEFGDTVDDLRLCSTHVDGKYAYVGFSTLLLGCNEGMNEHGLAVTMSVGGMPVGVLEGFRPPIQDGVQFWALVRSILEQCQNVDQALRLIDEMPLCGNPNLIVTDRAGNAALVEVFGPHKAVKRIDSTGPEKYLHSTNHFTLPETRQHSPGVLNHSQVRYQTIQSRLDKASPR